MTYAVAGWSGAIITNGAGIREPVLYDSEAEHYGSSLRSTTWYTGQEIHDLAARGSSRFGTFTNMRSPTESSCTRRMISCNRR